ncbi:N-alpha-acetyltransferase 10, NatA catalytic subunit [Pisolithus sp. B1]|nr:N-alpha-acetyltransferase 10, NatA catalytic subunit [Pisolithus sp. B1]
MLNIRPANPKDIINIQRCNQLWALCLVSWPHASGRIVGYVLASVEPIDDDHSHLLVGHINSLAVIRRYRRLGIAKRLMDISKESMTSMHHIQYIQLNVRVSNRAALALYRDALGYTIHCIEHKYYADGENAFSMRLWIHGDPSTGAYEVSSFYLFIPSRWTALTNLPYTRQERQTVLRALCQYASHKGQLLLACVRRSRSPQR